MKNRYAIAALAATLAFGSFVAMAASLGGLTAENLGAESSVIASCDADGVTTSYTVVYDGAPDSRYEVTEVIVGGVDATCAGQSMTVTLTDASNVSLDAATVTAATGSNTVALAAPPSAEAVANVHLVITG